jgi:hypothetical protein
MYDPAYYRQQAERARRLAGSIYDQEASEALTAAANNFEEVADDLESGAIEIRHRERMPQNSKIVAVELRSRTRSDIGQSSDQIDRSAVS